MTVAIPIVDILLDQLQQRFGGLQQTAMKGYCLLPEMFLQDSSTARQSIKTLASEYQHFLAGPGSLEAELDT